MADTREDLTAPERAALDAWMRGSADTTGMLYAVRHALAAAGPTLAPDARERLARHLFLAEWPDSRSAQRAWDEKRITRDPYIARANELVAVITGKDTSR